MHNCGSRYHLSWSPVILTPWYIDRRRLRGLTHLKEVVKSDARCTPIVDLV